MRIAERCKARLDNRRDTTHPRDGIGMSREQHGAPEKRGFRFWAPGGRLIPAWTRSLAPLVLLTFLAPLNPPPLARAVESAAPVPLVETLVDTNAERLALSYQQLQEQLRATQQTIERNRQETDVAAARNAEALKNQLQLIEQSMAAQRARELEAMQGSNRVMLVVAGAFGAVGFLAVLLMAYFQWRAMDRLAEISTSPPSTQPLPLTPLNVNGGDSMPLARINQVDQANLRLFDALERLEKRIYELEHATVPALKAAPVYPSAAAKSNGDAPAQAPRSSVASEEEKLSSLLGKGQSLLSLDKAEEALVCFEEALELAPDHAEALVRKGAALEKLGRLDEAGACYDRAIVLDGTLTIAYLYKGGLYNRMERFGEALECYEKALRTQG
jgi:tetratricopeptide (TPR) repeat protein